MSHNFESILNECLNLLQQGRTVEACIERFPQYADELRPLLEIAAAIHHSDKPQLNQLALQQSQEKMLAAWKTKYENTESNSRSAFPGFLIQFFRKYQPEGNFYFRFAIASAFTLLLLFAGSIFVTSANSLPGDTLYPVKILAEDLQYKLTLNPVSRQELVNIFQKKRQTEVQMLLDKRRAAQVHFVGKLVKIDNNIWFIEQFKVLVDSNTSIIGVPEIGKIIEVWGITNVDGKIEAIKIQIGGKSEVKPGNNTSTPLPTNTSLMQIMDASPTPTPTAAAMDTSNPTDTLCPTDIPPSATEISFPTNTPIATTPLVPTKWITYMPGNTETPLPTNIPTYIIKPTCTPRATRMIPTEWTTYIPPSGSNNTPIPPQSTPNPTQIYIITTIPGP